MKPRSYVAGMSMAVLPANQCILYGRRSDNEDIDKTAQFYQAQFDQPPVRDDTGRYVWRFKGENSELIYSVRLSSSTGPWSGCSDQPINFKTIVMISNGFWKKQS